MMRSWLLSMEGEMLIFLISSCWKLKERLFSVIWL